MKVSELGIDSVTSHSLNQSQSLTCFVSPVTCFVSPGIQTYYYHIIQYNKQRKYHTSHLCTWYLFKSKTASTVMTYNKPFVFESKGIKTTRLTAKSMIGYTGISLLIKFLHLCQMYKNTATVINKWNLYKNPCKYCNCRFSNNKAAFHDTMYNPSQIY